MPPSDHYGLQPIVSWDVDRKEKRLPVVNAPAGAVRLRVYFFTNGLFSTSPNQPSVSNQYFWRSASQPLAVYNWIHVFKNVKKSGSPCELQNRRGSS